MEARLCTLGCAERLLNQDPVSPLCVCCACAEHKTIFVLVFQV